jgi:hypothetical protein
MFFRALIVWLGILVLAFANGAARELWIIPRAGELPGHVVSTVALCLAILVTSWFSIDWIRPLTGKDAWAVGAGWLTLTLAFEFLAGHYLFGNPWSRVLADYNVLRGRIWILVLATTVLAPAFAASARGPAVPH